MQADAKAAFTDLLNDAKRAQERYRGDGYAEKLEVCCRLGLAMLAKKTAAAVKIARSDYGNVKAARNAYPTPEEVAEIEGAAPTVAAKAAKPAGAPSGK